MVTLILTKQAQCAAVVLIYCVVGSALTLANKLCMLHFPHASVVLVIQCTVTLGLLVGSQTVCAKFVEPIEPLSWKLVGAWLPLTLLFVLMLVSSLVGFKYVTVQASVVLRNTTTLVVAAQESMFLKKRFTATEVASLIVIVVGATIYARNDLRFDSKGYTWLFLNVVVSSGYQIYVKVLVKQCGLNTSSMAYYNNSLSLPVLIILSLVQCEARHMTEVFTIGWKAQAVVFGSALLGFVISLAGFYLNRLLSPTSIMVINNLNKFVLIFLAEALFEPSLTLVSLFGCVLAIGAGGMYSYAAFNNNNSAAEPSRRSQGTNFNFLFCTTTACAVFILAISTTFTVILPSVFDSKPGHNLSESELSNVNFEGELLTMSNRSFLNDTQYE